MGFIAKAVLRLVITAGAFLIIAQVVPGVHITSFTTAVVVAVLWGLVTLIIRPVLLLLTLPINFLSLGLFTFVLNALLFWVVAALVPGFTVSGFIPALEGSVLLSVVGWALHAVL